LECVHEQEGTKEYDDIIVYIMQLLGLLETRLKWPKKPLTCRWQY